MSEQEIRAGQIWRRKSDGHEVQVLNVDPVWSGRRQVVHRGRRRTWTEYGPFLRKYEFVKEAPDDRA